MRRVSAFWGIAVILLGTLLLLDTLDLLRFNWGVAWGVFLVVLGGWLLWGWRHRSEALGQAGERTELALNGATSAEVTMRHGAGRLTVRGGTEPGLLFEGNFGGGLDCRSRRRGDTLEVDMRVRDPGLAFSAIPVGLASGAGLDWNFSLCDSIPLTLEIETGASENELDLSRLRLSELRVRTGASATKLVLPAHAGHTDVSLEAGGAALDVELPPGVAGRIRADGLGSIRVDAERFPQHGGVYQSPGFDTAIDRVEIRAGVGMGSLTVQ